MSLEDSYKSKIHWSEETMKKREKAMANTKDNSSKTVDQLMENNDEEIRLINQAWNGTEKLLQIKCEELQGNLEEIEKQITKEEKILLQLKGQKERTVQELKSKLNHSMKLEMDLSKKNLENRINIIEKSKEALYAKIEELNDETRDEEKKYGEMETELEKANNELRLNIIELKKDLTENFNENERCLKNASMVTAEVEVR